MSLVVARHYKPMLVERLFAKLSSVGGLLLAGGVAWALGMRVVWEWAIETHGLSGGLPVDAHTILQGALCVGACALVPPRSGWRLLVAEDNLANQTVARMLITKMGHSVDVANDGHAALALLVQRVYDAVLMDCQMPGLDGYDTTRRIRSGAIAGINPRVPIIALTAYVMTSEQEKCRAAGMDDWVSKPLRAGELSAALQRCGLRVEAVVPESSTQVSIEASEVCDPAVMAQLRAWPGVRGASLLTEVIETFLESGTADLASIVRCAAARDAAGLVATAHRLAGSCANLGAQESRTAAMALEQAADGQDWSAADVHLAELQAAFARLRAHLKALTI